MAKASVLKKFNRLLSNAAVKNQPRVAHWQDEMIAEAGYFRLIDDYHSVVRLRDFGQAMTEAERP